MKLLACLLLLLPSLGASAQAGTQIRSVDALSADLRRGKELHARSLRIVQSEQARGKQPLCPKAMTTLDINDCYSAELRVTDTNYLGVVRTLGALLRLEENGKSTSSQIAIPFDTAEAAWQNYRDLACKAAGDEYAGGTIRPSIEMGCRLTITRHHINELWDVYSDLGTR
jgi:uncharacterized protein YecT (DUF1311 family)